MDWKKGILTVVITASIAVCPFSSAFAEWDDSDRYLLVDIQNAVLTIIPGRLDLIRADVTDILSTISGLKYAIGESSDGEINGGMDGSINARLRWMQNNMITKDNSPLSKIAATIGGTSDAANPPSWSTTISGRLRWLQENLLTTSNANVKNVFNAIGKPDDAANAPSWSTSITGRIRWLQENLLTTSNSNVQKMFAAIGTTGDAANPPSWSTSINGRLRWIEENMLTTSNTNLSNMFGAIGTANDASQPVGWSNSIVGRLRWMQENWPSSSGASSVWTTDNVSDLLVGVQAIRDSVSDLASGIEGGGLYYLNVIADELHKTDPGYLKEWLIDIYDAIGTQTTQLQEAIEGINDGGSSGGSSADLSTIEGLLGKLTYYSDGATGYILKVYDLGVFDQLTDVNTELIGIRTLLGQFFAADTASDVIGEVDFSEIADKSNATLDTISTLAPFGSILLYSECVAILSTTPAVQEPKLVFDFNFCPGVNEHITLDFSWLDPMHDAINFACMLMLVMGLASITMRYVELEAAS